MLKGAAALLLVVVALVLVIACTNLASLLLARATDRQQEMAVRLALGAGRRALVRQLLVESIVLGLAAGAAGLVLGVWAARALLAIDLPIGVPIGIEARSTRACSRSRSSCRCSRPPLRSDARAPLDPAGAGLRAAQRRDGRDRRRPLRPAQPAW
jgi:hypothetical protein